MVDRHCRGRLDLFPSTKVNNMFKNYLINNNNDNVPFLHVFNSKSNKHKHKQVLCTHIVTYRWNVHRPEKGDKNVRHSTEKEFSQTKVKRSFPITTYVVQFLPLFMTVFRLTVIVPKRVLSPDRLHDRWQSSKASCAFVFTIMIGPTYLTSKIWEILRQDRRSVKTDQMDRSSVSSQFVREPLSWKRFIDDAGVLFTCYCNC